MAEQEIFDLTIIGGGTTGLFAAYYGTMRKMKVKVIESQAQFGGKVMQFFPEKLIYDIGGFPAVFGETLVKQMIEQANRHQPVMINNEWIESIEQSGDLFILIAANGAKHFTKTILLATGSGTFHTKRTNEWQSLPFPEFRKQVATNLMDRDKYEDKNVIIVSDNKTGVGWALYLKDKATSVIVINSSNQFHHVKEADLEQLLESNVQVYFNSELTDLDVDDQQLKAVNITTENKINLRLKAEEMLTFHGLELQATPLNQWGGIETSIGRIV
ncbi:thioredoxin reductase [Gracilibacillus boraciitolerans JCM 21714]|uniref:Thioredoxin reductase n=1 Tax=Gracilibacillus boraciitolerans JCM 21714 TaxID=1298598 RepID=W4VL27_9BACI|nr:thioredoxin reductase [Gracilibacillus boraciitolerans JCM 21714]